MKKCPYCSETDLQGDAKICKHCGKDVRKITLGKIFLIILFAFVVIPVIIAVSTLNNSPIPTDNSSSIDKKEVKMLWDIPRLMNKSHNQIVKILGNPATIKELLEGKSRLFEFKDGKKKLILEENLPARLGMKTAEYDVSYEQSDCEMAVCGNDLSYSYTNPDKPIKYFFLLNYPVEKPALSVAELKQIGNLNSATLIKVVPSYAKWPNGMVLIGLDICEKKYQGSEYEDGSKNCSK